MSANPEDIEREKMLAAVKQDWYELTYASEALQNDKEVVLAAVQNNGYQTSTIFAGWRQLGLPVSE